MINYLKIQEIGVNLKKILDFTCNSGKNKLYL